MRNYFYFYFSSRQPAKLIKLNKKFSPRFARDLSQNCVHCNWFGSSVNIDHEVPRIRSWYKNLFSIFYFPGGEPAEPTDVV